MQTLQVLKCVYGHHITDTPKRAAGKSSSGRSESLAWIYTSKNFKEWKSFRTASSVRKYTQKDFYISPNGFYHSKERNKETVRWINAIVLDFDNDNYFDAQEKIDLAGLPQPTFLVKTPSGGAHAWFVLDAPLRSGKSPKTRVLVEAIQRTMILATGADLNALGVERVYRYPHADTLVIPQLPLQKVSLETLLDWREINFPEEIQDGRTPMYSFFSPEGFMNQSFFQELLAGVDNGTRNYAALTLALAMKYEKKTLEQTLETLLPWDKKNSPSLGARRVETIVRYAYRTKSPGPNMKRCQDIFGSTFQYNCTPWASAKPRAQRMRSHIAEWAEDVLDMLRAVGGRWQGSQRDLATQLKAHRRSVEEAIKRLEKLGHISKEIVGKGCASETILRLAQAPAEAVQTYIYETYQQVAAGAELMPHTAIYSIDGAVGWHFPSQKGEARPSAAVILDPKAVLCDGLKPSGIDIHHEGTTFVRYPCHKCIFSMRSAAVPRGIHSNAPRLWISIPRTARRLE